MKFIRVFQTLLCLMLFSYPLASLAWERSLELGYGKSHDPNHTEHYNSGYLLTSDIYPLRRTPWTFWSVNWALGKWQSTAPYNKNLSTTAVTLALRLYFYDVADRYPAYLLGSAGPAYLSARSFGENSQGSKLSGQWNLGLGAEFGNVDINFRAVHYSNAHLTKPDEGFNILYMLSFGFLF